MTLLLCSTLTVMAAATITPSLTGIAAYFAATPDAELLTRLVLTLPALFIVLVAPGAGFLCDRFGRKPVMLTGMALYVLCGSAGALVASLPQLLASRAGLGVGIALLMTATTSMLADSSHGDRQTRLLGLQGAFMAGGGVVFVLLGGLAAEWHWRAPFLVYLLALLLLPAVLRLPETGNRSRAEAAPSGQAPSEAPATRARTELLPLWPLFAMAFAGMVLFYLVPVYLPFLLGARFGASAGWVGAAVALVNIAAMTAGMQFGRVRGALPALAMVAITCVCMAAGYGLVGSSSSLAGLLPGLLVAGVGLGFMVPNLSHWTMQRAPLAVRGRAVGLLTMAFFLGQFASPLVAQPVAERAGYGGLYRLAAVVLLAGAAGAAAMLWRSRASSARLRSTPPP